MVGWSRSRVYLLLTIVLFLVLVHRLFAPSYPTYTGRLTVFDSSAPPGAVNIAEQSITVSTILEDIAATVNARVHHYDASSAAELGINLGHRSTLDMTQYVHSLQSAYEILYPSPSPSTTGQTILDLALSRLSLLPIAPPSPPIPKNIYTTDLRPPSEAPEQFASWASMNPDWETRFVDDDQMDEWFRTVFDEEVADELASLQGVVRADLFRYLVLLLNGGVYTDTDTACVRSISDWAQWPEMRHVSQLAAALPDLLRVVGGPQPPVGDDGPGLIVALEIDAPLNGLDWRSQSFVRGIQFVQWTILAKPGHPVLLDVVGHALRTTRATREAKEKGEEVEDADILNLSGPGAFTDAVLRFLLLRHGVHPYDLSGLQQPVRYGDVVIMPEHSFRADASEGYQGDFRVVWHGFFGRWKEEEAKKKRRRSMSSLREY